MRDRSYKLEHSTGMAVFDIRASNMHTTSYPMNKTTTNANYMAQIEYNNYNTQKTTNNLRDPTPPVGYFGLSASEIPIETYRPECHLYSRNVIPALSSLECREERRAQVYRRNARIALTSPRRAILCRAFL